MLPRTEMTLANDCIYLFIYRLGGGLEIRRQLSGVSSFAPSYRPEYQLQLVGFGSKHFYQLSHLAGPKIAIIHSANKY